MGEPYVGEIRMFGGNFAPAGWAFCNGALMPISENDALFNLIGTTYGGDGQETFALPDLQGRVPIHRGRGPGSVRTTSLGEKGGVESVTLTAAADPDPHPPDDGVGQRTGNSRSRPTGSWPRPIPGFPYVASSQPFKQLNAGSVAESAAASRTRTCSRTWRSASSFRCSASSRRRARRGTIMSDPFVAEIRMFGGNFAPTGWAQCNGQLLPISQNTALFSLLGTIYGGDGKSTFALPNLQGSVPIGQGQGAA